MMAYLRHNTLRGGILLGLIIATVIWVWLYVIDALVGEPLRTFSLLGGVARFTALHYALCCLYGIAAVAVVHGAAREPNLLIAAAFAFILFETAFAILTAVLQQVGLGQLAWIRIMGGQPGRGSSDRHRAGQDASPARGTAAGRGGNRGLSIASPPRTAGPTY